MSQAIQEIIAQATGVDSVHVSLFRPPLDHQSNQLYEAWAGDRHLIVKEFLKPAEFNEAPLREWWALELLAPLDIAPRPVVFQPASPPLGPLVVYEFMQGQMWNRQKPTAMGLAQLAEVWLKMNSVPTKGLWMSRGQARPFDEIEASLRAGLQAYAEWARIEFTPGRQAAELCLATLDSRHAAIEELSRCSPLLCFCCADPRFANVIERPDGRLGLVDWEDSGLRDPARDLADLVTHPNQEDLLTPDEWQAFLQPYLAVRGKMDPQIKHRMQLYLSIFPIFWIAVLIRDGFQLACNGQLANWTTNSIPATQRLHCYLARALAWPEMDFSKQMEALQDIRFFPDSSFPSKANP